MWQRTNRELVGFLKIDTEGWGAKILMGARDLIRTCRPNLLVEFNRERMRNLSIPLDGVWQFLVDQLQCDCYRIDECGREIRLTAPEAWENLLFVASARKSAS